MDNYNPDGYDSDTPEAKAKTFEEIATCILSDVKRVKAFEFNRCLSYTWQKAFEDWAAGLPGLLDTCYYYNRSAVDDLAAILQETDSEKAKYSESQAESVLSRLIFRELRKAAGHVLY